MKEEEQLTMELTLLRLAEWIAIEHNETRLQADKYTEEAQGLADLLSVIGYKLIGYDIPWEKIEAVTEICKNCQGSGMYTEVDYIGKPDVVTCIGCKGSGKIVQWDRLVVWNELTEARLIYEVLAIKKQTYAEAIIKIKEILGITGDAK